MQNDQRYQRYNYQRSENSNVSVLYVYVFNYPDVLVIDSIYKYSSHAEYVIDVKHENMHAYQRTTARQCYSLPKRYENIRRLVITV